MQNTFPDKSDADTFHVLIILSLLGIESANQIKKYYDESILLFLYLEAKVKSQDLSRFYTKLGSSVLETKLIINHLDYLFNKCG